MDILAIAPAPNKASKGTGIATTRQRPAMPAPLAESAGCRYIGGKRKSWPAASILIHALHA